MSSNEEKPIPPVPDAQPLYTRTDFVSGQEVRWCPGCGNYSILGAVQQTLAKFNTPKENYVFVSGIGCSSRFPYYMNTYGFHTIHGRAPAVATGLCCVNPHLSIWVITGDGDGLSIGSNHLVHAMRRNLDINILFINNQIYGLTKGQYSPTSLQGKITKSSPYGSLDHPINPLCIAIASEATFIARTLDSDPRHMSQILARAKEHKGTSFIEIFQNCIIFNDKTFAPVTSRETRDDRMIYLEHGKPLIFGAKKNKTIKVKNLHPEIVDYDPAADPAGYFIHDEKDVWPHHPYFLTQLTYPDFPMPFGVFRCVQTSTYDQLMDKQIADVKDKRGDGNLKDLIYGKETWKIE